MGSLHIGDMSETHPLDTMPSGCMTHYAADSRETLPPPETPPHLMKSLRVQSPSVSASADNITALEVKCGSPANSLTESVERPVNRFSNEVNIHRFSVNSSSKGSGKCESRTTWSGSYETSWYRPFDRYGFSDSVDSGRRKPLSSSSFQQSHSSTLSLKKAKATHIRALTTTTVPRTSDDDVEDEDDFEVESILDAIYDLTQPGLYATSASSESPPVSHASLRTHRFADRNSYSLHLEFAEDSAHEEGTHTPKGDDDDVWNGDWIAQTHTVCDTHVSSSSHGHHISFYPTVSGDRPQDLRRLSTPTSEPRRLPRLGHGESSAAKSCAEDTRTGSIGAFLIQDNCISRILKKTAWFTFHLSIAISAACVYSAWQIHLGFSGLPTILHITLFCISFWPRLMVKLFNRDRYVLPVMSAIVAADIAYGMCWASLQPLTKPASIHVTWLQCLSVILAYQAMFCWKWNERRALEASHLSSFFVAADSALNLGVG
eukprot:Blabericola_migrator_1__4609@NODE_2446_length_2747_cov_17_156343_g1530_i0_p1_GENE_NODE_2446_length_2747_cov_17_156343_g1530_i0NODE_2446_length_2747_cov_17_156343_g1530_i0_p1_ORF_typecomplete_len488_score57_90_NODE_2446_length_2747_cov_17_156343_g1530_i05552018